MMYDHTDAYNALLIAVPDSLEPLRDAYVRLWGAYQMLASAFHQKTKQLEAEIRELREL